MNSIAFLLRYCHYIIVAKSRYFIHSPFIFEFTNQVLKSKDERAKCKEIELLRRKLKSNNDTIYVKDFGSGNDRKRTIKDIAKTSAKQKRMAEILHNLVLHYKPKSLVELGTSLGISCMYQAAATENNILTIEGCPATAKLAKGHFNQLGFKNIESRTGNFDELFGEVLKERPEIDYCFVDGNHTYEATIRYFNQLLETVKESSIFVFDDIHWSDGMEKAWNEIRTNSKVTLSIDLFFIGIVFFKEGVEKQDFVLYH